MIEDPLEELASRRIVTRAQAREEWGEPVEMELRRHPAVAGREVFGEPAYEYVGHDEPVTVYAVLIGGEVEVETTDPGVAERCAGGDGVEVEARETIPPAPPDAVAASAAEVLGSTY